jgi:hypothetical protein
LTEKNNIYLQRWVKILQRPTIPQFIAPSHSVFSLAGVRPCSIAQTRSRENQRRQRFKLYAVHDYFKHAGGRNIFLLDWRQVLSYDVSFLNVRIVVNSVINLVNKNLPRTALQIIMYVSFQLQFYDYCS